MSSLPPELASRGTFKPLPRTGEGYSPFTGYRPGRADLVAAKQEQAAAAKRDPQTKTTKPTRRAEPVEPKAPVGYLENLPQWLRELLAEMEAAGDKLPANEATVLDVLWKAQRYVTEDYVRTVTGMPKKGGSSATAALRGLAARDLATSEGRGASEAWSAAVPARYAKQA